MWELANNQIHILVLLKNEDLIINYSTLFFEIQMRIINLEKDTIKTLL